MFDRPEKQDKKGKKAPKIKPGQQFMSNILSVVLILLIMIAGYSLLTENREELEEIPISELATQVVSGEVTKIVVEGDKVQCEDDEPLWNVRHLSELQIRYQLPLSRKPLSKITAISKLMIDKLLAPAYIPTTSSQSFVDFCVRMYRYVCHEQFDSFRYK